MPNVQIEFTNDTLVMTERGVERLESLLHRDVKPCLWAIKWEGGMSFHKTHKTAKTFAEMQLGCSPQGPARLIDVSESIYQAVSKAGFLVTALTCFSQAINHEVVETWKH